MLLSSKWPWNRSSNLHIRTWHNPTSFPACFLLAAHPPPDHSSSVLRYIPFTSTEKNALFSGPSSIFLFLFSADFIYLAFLLKQSLALIFLIIPLLKQHIQIEEITQTLWEREQCNEGKRKSSKITQGINEKDSLHRSQPNTIKTVFLQPYNRKSLLWQKLRTAYQWSP